MDRPRINVCRTCERRAPNAMIIRPPAAKSHNGFWVHEILIGSSTVKPPNNSSLLALPRQVPDSTSQNERGNNAPKNGLVTKVLKRTQKPDAIKTKAQP